MKLLSDLVTTRTEFQFSKTRTRNFLQSDSISRFRSHCVKTNWPTYLSVVVESVLLGDLVGSLRSAGYVNGELIRIDWHWTLSWSGFGSRAGQQRAQNQQRHPEDHVVDVVWWWLSRYTIFPALTEPRDASRLTLEDTRVHADFAVQFRMERMTPRESIHDGQLASLTSDNRRTSLPAGCTSCRSGTTNVVDERVWRIKSYRGDRDETAFAAREFRSSSSSSSSARQRSGAGLILQQRRGKAQVIAQCAFASRAQSRKDAVGILANAERCVILIVTGGKRGGVSWFFLLLDVRAADLHHNVSPWACCTRMFANFLPLPLLRAHCYNKQFVSREREKKGVEGRKHSRVI